MNNQKQKLNHLFNKFAEEEKGVSSFALSNLLNRTIGIIEEELKVKNYDEDISEAD